MVLGLGRIDLRGYCTMRRDDFKFAVPNYLWSLEEIKMVQFDYAERSDGEIVNAANIVAEDRHKYTDLVCPACREPMTAAVGKVVVSHFRRRVGEHCSDYFAQVIEKTIEYSYRQRQANNQTYELALPNGKIINLAKTGAELERNKINNGCRVDLRFCTKAGQIEIVV